MFAFFSGPATVFGQASRSLNVPFQVSEDLLIGQILNAGAPVQQGYNGIDTGLPILRKSKP